MDDYLQKLLKNAKSLSAKRDGIAAFWDAPEIIAHPKLWRKYADEFERLNRVLNIADECEKNPTSINITRLKDGLLGAEYGEVIVDFSTKDKSARAEIIDILDAFKLNSINAGYTAEVLGQTRIKLSGAGAEAEFLPQNGTGRGKVLLTVVKNLNEEYSLSDKDVRTDLFHSGGAGGQNVNKVETAVRLTHIKSGVSVVCQDERSQLKNRVRATERLAERVAEYYKKKNATELERRITAAKRESK